MISCDRQKCLPHKTNKRAQSTSNFFNAHNNNQQPTTKQQNKTKTKHITSTLTRQKKRHKTDSKAKQTNKQQQNHTNKINKTKLQNVQSAVKAVVMKYILRHFLKTSI